MTTSPEQEARREAAPASAAGPGKASVLPRTGVLIAIILVVWLTLTAIRFAGPDDWRDHDQERPLSYVMDVRINGNWICQRDYVGIVASKPPLYTWLIALAALPFDEVHRICVYLPCAIAVGLTALLLFLAGRAAFSQGAGFFAALVYLLSNTGMKQLCLARTDPVFTFLIALTAFLGYRAWRHEKSWLPFWLVAAVATLTKGPLGLALASCGFLAWFVERRRGAGVPFRTGLLPGLGLYVLISAGWAFAAYLACGMDFVNKMIFSELVGHSVGGYKDRLPLVGFYNAPVYFVTRFMPWSLLTILALWRVVKRPATDGTARGVERYVFCLFLGGLFLFSLAAHHRAGLIFPILPAAALLAGRELDRLLTIASIGRFCRLVLPGIALFVIGLGVYYLVVLAGTDDVKQTAMIRDMAGRIEESGLPADELEHCVSYFTVQFYLNTMKTELSIEEARARLAAPEPAYVAVGAIRAEDWEALSAGLELYEPDRVPAEGPPVLRIVSNRRELPAAPADRKDG